MTKPRDSREVGPCQDAEPTGQVLIRAFEAALPRGLPIAEQVLSRVRRNMRGHSVELLQAYPGDGIALVSLVGPPLHLVAIVVRVEDLLGV